VTAPPQIFTPEYYRRMRELESEGWWNAAMRDAADMLLRQAALPERGTLLDVGCGSGQTMAWFTDARPGWTAVGLDVALDGLRAARSFGQAVSHASALELPHPDDSVDAVITLDVVQHLPLGGGDLTALREIKRVLKPGGYLLLRTNAQAFPRAEDDAEYNFHKYEPDELRAKLEAAGLSVVRLSRINALLGLAEIPREMRARRAQESEYHGILAEARPEPSWMRSMKKGWLRLEATAVSAGVRLPLGRTLLTLCRA
jgi:demethylmenaquinone methyltransferase/2-methoxy-6-polyprenyl-1,4-benzoquinol methylase